MLKSLWIWVLSVISALILTMLLFLLIKEFIVYIQGFSATKFFTPTDHATTSAAIASLIAAITTVFAVAVAIFAGYYAKRQWNAANDQLKATRKQLLIGQNSAYGDFLLRLDEAFQRHQSTHTKLRPGGDWSKVGPDNKWREKEDGPEFPKDGPDIEGYMGLFERVQVLLEKDLIDINTVNRLYGYRLFNIVDNSIIHEAKLVKLGDGWKDFIKLWRDLSNLESNKGKKQPDAKVLSHLDH